MLMLRSDPIDQLRFAKTRLHLRELDTSRELARRDYAAPYRSQNVQCTL